MREWVKQKRERVEETGRKPGQILPSVEDWLKDAACAVWITSKKYPAIAVLGGVLPGVFIIWCHWGWFGAGGTDKQPSNGDVLRNLALTLAGFVGLFVGLPLVGWRSWTAHRQAETANRQAKTANRQTDTAERGHRDGRYEKGVDMLGSAVLTTRMGGISALSRLAETHPEDYHVQVMEALAGFIRFPTKDEDLVKSLKEGAEDNAAQKKDQPQVCRPDVEAAAQAIGKRRKALKGKLSDIESEYQLGERNANLAGVDLWNADLSRARLRDVKNLTQAQLNMACIQEGLPMTHPTYELTLHKTYYEKGFFNLGVEIENYVTKDECPVSLLLGPQRQQIGGRVTRTANLNGTPRVFGGAKLRDWFFANFNTLDQVRVLVLSPTELQILAKKD